MNEHEQGHTGHDYHYADQPKPPAGGEGCKEYEEPKIPNWDEPEKCPEPDKCCDCPQKPGETATCLDALIAKQAAEVVASENAAAFKGVLEALLTAAKDAAGKYTPDKHRELIEIWVEQDKKIVDVIQTIVCKVRCWRCVIDCHVCPLLYQVHKAQKSLYDDGKLYETVEDLYDLEYFHKRNKEAKERRLKRIESVLAVWQAPEKTIREALEKNKALIESAQANVGKEPGKVIYDVFLQIVPMHLAIAPPRDSKWKTKIEKEFTGFCQCGTPEPDDCCGPNVGEGSLLDQLIGPQPYLIDPNDYFKLICCLVEKRYEPAQKKLKEAATALANVQARIAAYENFLKDWRKDFKARDTIPSAIKCSDYEPKGQPRSSSAE
jgi:hypothetical protein